MADKFSGVRVVSEIAIELRTHIVSLAGERRWFDTRESWLRSAARKADISYRMARSLFYCEIADPRASIVERIRAAVTKDQKAEHDARAELAAIRDQLTSLARHMASVDPEYFGESIALLEQAARTARGEAAAASDPNGALD